MRTALLAAVIALAAAGCAQSRSSMDAVPDRGGHAYNLAGPAGGAGDDVARADDGTAPASRGGGAAGAGETTVTVQPGDALYAIAERSGVSLRALIRRNDITRRPVPVGTTLVVPAR